MANVTARPTSRDAVAPERRMREDDECPVETALAVVGGKWKVLILWHLQERGTMRFAELQRAVEGVTAKVLSQQLRELERAGMVTRRVYAEVPPRVEYDLSALGRTFRGALDALCTWGQVVIDARGGGAEPTGRG